MSDVMMLWEIQELLQKRKTLTREINTLPFIAQYKEERALLDRMLAAQKELVGRLRVAPDDQALREQYKDLQERLSRQRQMVVALQREGKDQYDHLMADLDAIPERIEAIKRKIRPDLWRKFERLLNEKQGRAIAKVRKRHCLGCGVRLSDVVLSRLRAASTSIVECEHCGRLLIWE